MLGIGRPDPVSEELHSSGAEFSALELVYSERRERFEKYRDENSRSRTGDTVVMREQLRDYGRGTRKDEATNNRHDLVLPLGKALTVKHAYRIAGMLPDVVVDQRDESPQEAYRSDTMEKVAWAIIRASGDATPFSAASWNASEIGAGCLELKMDYKLNIPCIKSVDPCGILEVPGVDDPHNFQRVYKFWDVPLASLQEEYRGKLFRGQPIDVSSIQGWKTVGGVDMVRVVQKCDGNSYLRFATGSTGSTPVGLWEYEHGYGFCPYVIIPNLGPYEDIWGWADYEFVRALTEYMPIMLSREADVLRAVASGAYISEGTGQNGSVIADIIREGGVLNSNREGTVQPIQPAEMPNFAETHAARIQQMIQWLGFAPDAAWGESGATSGTDRGLQLQPLLEYTAMKQLNWTKALTRLFGMAFQVLEKKQIGTSTYRGAKISGKSRRSQPFSFMLGQNSAPIQAQIDTGDPLDPLLEVELPTTPKELFDGDYHVRFVFRNMVDPDDPAYVLSETNKFSIGVQSLETTLENLGFEAPEDEMRRIEKEAERFPWINDGRVSLLMAQLRGNAQGTGGGAPTDTAGAMGDALSSMTSGAAGAGSGALDADALGAAQGATGLPYGQA